MNLPPSITPEIYQRAVEFATDWRPARRCVDTTWTLEEGAARCDECAYLVEGPINIDNRAHDILLPPLTDELLMAMLRKGQKRDKVFVGHVSDLIIHEDESLEAAIILAAASMGESR